METERRKRFLINTAFIATVVGLWFLSIKLLSGVLLPFALALLVAVGLHKTVDKISSRLKLKRKPVAVLTVMLFYVLVVSALALFLYLCFKQLNGVAEDIPQYVEKLSETLQMFSEKLGRFIGNFPDGTAGIFEKIPQIALESVTEGITSFVAELAASFASSVPLFMVSLVVMVVASTYLAKDYDDIRTYFKNNFSRLGLSRIIELKNVCFGNLFKILKSYFIILSITFAEVFLGLTVLGFRYSFISALVISVVDILPVLGCGTVLVPWGVICALNGDFGHAVGLAVLYLIITAVRHFIEPKIIGDKVGVHPFIMLLSVVVGLKLFGGVGVLLVPMTVIVLKNLPWHPKGEEGQTENQS